MPPNRPINGDSQSNPHANGSHHSDNNGNDFVYMMWTPGTANGNPDAVLNAAHECVIEGARGDIHVPAKDDDKDVEGPAPGSRLAIYQMLARFEKFDVDTAALAGDKRMAEDDTIEEQEKLLKQLKAQAEAQKKEE